MSPDKTTPAAGNRARRWAAGSALLVGGAVGGGILAGSLTAGASTTSTTTPQTAAGPSNATPRTPPGFPGGASGYGLNESGTVTAVGTSSVTIKTSTGTTTYAVNSGSDIDKNGEASLSSLKVGDAVTFSTVTSGSTQTIAILPAPRAFGTPPV